MYPPPILLETLPATSRQITSRSFDGITSQLQPGEVLLAQRVNGSTTFHHVKCAQEWSAIFNAVSSHEPCDFKADLQFYAVPQHIVSS